MKIWYQSLTPLGRDPSLRPYEEGLQTLLRKAARPDTEVTVHGTEVAGPLQYYYSRLLTYPEIVNNAIKAEREGYDGFCVGCMTDAAHYEVIETVDIPVCFIAETCMHVACMLAPKFALLGYQKLSAQRVTVLARHYGLQDRLVPCDSLKINLPDLPQAFDNPGLILEPAKKVVREAAAAGAGIMIPTCGMFHTIFASHKIRELEGIPILAGPQVLVKMTEMMVDLAKIGIKRSRVGSYTPMPKEEILALRRLHSIE